MSDLPIVGRSWDPNASGPMSPRIGVGSPSQTAIDLDEVEYTAPSEEYWVQTCRCLRQPRVKQFCRANFLGLVGALVMTGVFLAVIITIMVVPQGATSTEPVGGTTGGSTACSTFIAWPSGSVLIRNPNLITQLITYTSRSAADATTTKVGIDAAFEVTEWDFVARYDADSGLIRLYGPSIAIADADAHFGAAGAWDTPATHNSFGFLPNQYSVASAASWYGREVIDPSDPTSTSVTRRALHQQKTTEASRRTQIVLPLPHSLRGTNGTSNSTGSSPGVTLGEVTFYVFNNRSDVHIGAYRTTTAATSADNATATSASSSDSGPSLLPIYTLALSMGSDQVLSVCGQRFSAANVNETVVSTSGG